MLTLGSRPVRTRVVFLASVPTELTPRIRLREVMRVSVGECNLGHIAVRSGSEPHRYGCSGAGRRNHRSSATARSGLHPESCPKSDTHRPGCRTSAPACLTNTSNLKSVEVTREILKSGVRPYMLLILSCQVSETRHVKSGRYCARSGLSVPIFRQVKVGSASSGWSRSLASAG